MTLSKCFYRNKKFILLCLLLLAGNLHIFSQRLLFNTYRLNENRYEVGNDIVSNYVKVIFQTRQKLLFVGTKFGFCVYDGNKFRNYTKLENNYIGSVNDFTELPDGRILVLSNSKGILVFEKNKLSEFAVSPREVHPRFINFHKTPSGKLLVSSSNGVYQFRKDHFVKTILDVPGTTNYYYDLENINDTVLLASNAAGARFVIFDNNFKTLRSYPMADVVYDVQADKTGNYYWMATPGGLKCVKTKDLLAGTFNYEKMPSALAAAGIDAKIVITLYADAYSNLWAGTAFGGLFRIDPQLNVQQYHFKNGFNFDRVNCFFEDVEHNLWLGTENGLVKIPDPRITQYISDDGLRTSTVHSLYTYGDELFGISNSNVFRVNEKDHNRIEVVDTLPEAVGLFSSSTQLFAYSSQAVKLVNKKKTGGYSSSVCYEAPDSVVFKRGGVAVNRERLLIPLEKGGLYSVRGKKGQALSDFSFVIDDMYFDARSNLLWVIELDKALRIYRLHPEHDTHELLLRDTSLCKAVSAIYADKQGFIWVASRDAGIFRVALEERTLKVQQHMGIREGLSSNFCTTILQTSTGKLFTGNIASLDIIQLIDDHYVSTNLAAQLGYYNEIYTLAEDKAGNVWAGGLNGLLMIPPDANLLTPAKTATFITRLELTDTLIEDPAARGIRHLDLPWNQNDITFQFASPYLKSEAMVRYSYRLMRKSDTLWSQPFTNTSLALKDLPPGDFIFQVKALYPDGSSSDNIAAFSFRILTPWYRSWWFITACLLVLAAALYGLYRYRLQQVIRLQQVRNRIATDLHDEIGSTLTNINILSTLGKKNLHQPEQATEFLNRITEEVNSSSQALDDIIWSVNTNNDAIEEMVARMRRYAAELFDAGLVSYEFHLDPRLSLKKLSMEQRRDVYLIFKELLNNIYKHAGARNVSINIFTERNDLVLSVKDDGKGFDAQRVTDRNGLKNLHSRIGRWKGWLAIHTGANEGTSITARLPVHG